MNKTVKRRIIIASVITGAVVIITAAALGILYYMSRTPRSDTVTAPVTAGVTIERNAEGTPLIVASNLHDAYLALGYLHGMDRLFLMEYHRAIARGNISRILGMKALPLERLSAGLEIDSRAEAMLRQLSPEHKDYLEAYCRGINAARSGRSRNSAIYRQWDPADVLAILLMREWSNAFLCNRELLFPLPEKHRLTPAGAFFPRDLQSFFSPEEEKALLDLMTLRKLVLEFIGTFNRGFAAYIDPLQYTGGTRLALFSMEGSLTVYPSQYPVLIRIGEQTIRAISVAGLPFLFSGSGANTDFFSFSLNCDSQEFFIEKSPDQDHTTYVSPYGPKKFRLIVRQSDAGSAPFRVRMTDNGPVVHDILYPEGQGEGLVTIRSLFPEADYVRSLFEIPASDSIDKISYLASACRSLPKVYLLGDKSRSIRITGGRLLASGGDGRTFRRGDMYLPSAEVFAHFQDTGYRENTLAGSGFTGDLPPYIRQNAIPSPARQKRLETLLFASQRLTPERVMDILKDTHSLTAEMFTPLFLSILKSNPVTSARIARLYFSDWSFRMDPDRVAPSIYRVLLESFVVETIGDEIGPWKDHMRENVFLLADPFMELLRKPVSPLYDNISTDRIETMENNFDLAFMKTMRILGRKKGPIMDDWRWGALHMGRFHIPIRETSIFSRLKPSVKKIRLGGSTDTVFEGTEDSDLIPFHITALCGYSAASEARILMNFGYSISPMSDFYYGKMGDSHFSDFTAADRKYSIDIVPGAAR